MYVSMNVPGVGTIYYQVPGLRPGIFSAGGPRPNQELAKPKDYPELILDATTLASIEEAAKGVADSGVRAALQGGLDTAVKAMQRRAGDFVTIKLGSPLEGAAA